MAEPQDSTPHAPALKSCSKCHVPQPLSEYTKDPSKATGLRPSCKTCQRAWRAANLEKCRAQVVAWREANRDANLERRRKKYAENRAPEIARKKAWRETHQEQLRAYRKTNNARDVEKLRQRRRADPEWARAVARAYVERHPERRKATCVAYAEAHREEIAAYAKAYAKEHAEERRAYDKAWKEAHREERRASARKWAKAHPAERCAMESRRRARKQGATAADPAAVTAFYKWARNAPSVRCYWCGKKTKPGKGRHVDHIIPLAKGGADSPENFCVACASCNTHKQALMPEDFAGQAELRFA